MTAAPDTWETRTLGEIVEVLDFARVPVSAKERAKRSGEVPYYGAAGQVGWIDDNIFNEPLILLGEDGVQFFDHDKPKAYLIDGPSWVNNHAHVLRARAEHVDRRFLHHYLNQADYRGFANGTTRLKLTQAAMKRLPVGLPSLDEQRRIVDILEDNLSRLDSGERALSIAEQRISGHRASQLQGLVAVARARRSLGALALSSGYGTSTKCAVGGPGMVVVRIPNVVDGRIDLRDVKRAVDGSVDLAALTLRRGDVLIVRTNGSRDLIGRSAVVDSDLNAAFASYLIRFVFDESQVRGQWVRLMLESPGIRATLEQMAASSAGQYNLGLAKLKGLEIPWLETEQQDQLIAVYERAEESRARLRGEICGARTRSLMLRGGLLDAAFSGRLTGRASDMDRVEELAATGAAS